MRRTTPLLVSMCVVCATPALRAIDPIPESQQAALATKSLEAYHSARTPIAPKKLQVVYFTPADREPEPRYRERLQAILEDIRAFYRDGMERAGFGPKTFDFARDAEGKLMIHLAKGKERESAYTRSGFQQDRGGDSRTRDKIRTACQTALAAAGISLDQETVVVFCNLAVWDEKARTFRHHSPYAGSATQVNGFCYAVDSVVLNLDDLTKKEPILHDGEWGNESPGKFNTIFIGGIAHELGHAFLLPHCGERWDEQPRGKSLMGVGNHTYREEQRGEGPGTFLAMASAMKLAARPLFSQTAQDMTLKPRLEESEFQLSTKVSLPVLAARRATLRVEGVVRGTPSVYGVIAYFDSHRSGGYDAPTATAVPDADGRFAMEISDLAPCRNGELRLEYCHVNGAISERRAPFQVTPEQALDLAQWEVMRTLGPLIRAVLHQELKNAHSELGKIENSHVSELAKTIARKLTATLEDKPELSPASAPSALTELALGDARPLVAEVGWLKPAANRIPTNDQIDSPLLDSGKLYATGLYAHAPSRYVFDLGGKWKTLHGEAGLHTLQQPYGSVVFIIKADGREAFRSATIRESAKASYAVDVTGAKKLELVVDDAGDTNHNDWALWLDPTLTR